MGGWVGGRVGEGVLVRREGGGRGGGHRQNTDEWLIMATAAPRTGYRIIKAWGYVLIILLNSDEILKRLSLRHTSRRDETK